MEIKDLMIGDWLQFDKSPIQVKALGDVIFATDESYYDEEDADLAPIPITDEFLDKLCFREPMLQDGNPWWTYGKKESDFRFSIGCAFNTSSREYNVHTDVTSISTIGRGQVTYIHELQNLIRATTGFSLLITKEMLI